MYLLLISMYRCFFVHMIAPIPFFLTLKRVSSPSVFGYRNAPHDFISKIDSSESQGTDTVLATSRSE